MDANFDDISLFNEKKIKIKRISFKKEYDYIEERIVNSIVISFQYQESNAVININIKAVDVATFILLHHSENYRIVIADISDRGLYNINYMISFIDEYNNELSFECHSLLTEFEDEDITEITKKNTAINKGNICELPEELLYVKKIDVYYSDIHTEKALTITLSHNIGYLLNDDLVITTSNFKINEIGDIAHLNAGKIRIFRQLDEPEYKYSILDECTDDMYSEFVILFNEIEIIKINDNNSIICYEINNFSNNLIFNRRARFTDQFDNSIIKLYDDAINGNITAIMNLYDIYKSEPINDTLNAFYWLRKGAELGSDRAQYDMGMVYLKGYNTEIDTSKAIEYFKAAKENGNKNAEKILNQLLH